MPSETLNELFELLLKAKGYALPLKYICLFTGIAPTKANAYLDYLSKTGYISKEKIPILQDTGRVEETYVYALTEKGLALHLKRNAKEKIKKLEEEVDNIA
jgi:hypothetical protein